MRAAPPIAALLLCVVCAGGLARADDVAGDAAADLSEDAQRVAARTAGILQGLAHWDGEDADTRADLIETIFELPSPDRPAIVHALASVTASGAPEEHAGVLLDVLDRLGRNAVKSTLSELATDDASRDDRALVFWFARSQESGAGLDNVLLAAAACDEAELASPAVRSHVRQAIHAELLRSEPDSHQLATLLKTVSPPVRVLVLDALERGGSRVSTRTISTLLGSDVPTDIALLRRLVRLPVREARPFDDVMGHRLPSYLKHRDTEVRRLSVLAAMRFRPKESIETVIRLLEDPAAGVRSAAHRALIARAGSRLLPERELWERWLRDERKYVADARKGLGAKANAHDAADARAALRAIRAHPLFGEKSILPVIHATTHDDADVRAQACTTLAALGDFSALTAVARRLEDDDEKVAGAASKALARLTGLRGPATAEEWHAELLLNL